MMKMNGLAQLYKSMRGQGLDYTIFDYTHNSVKLFILFDIKASPFKLLLAKKYSSLSLLLEIHQGFNLDTFLDKEKYQILIEMLEIKNGSTHFSTKAFFSELDSKIPKEAKKPILDHNLRLFISKAYQCEEADKIFLYGYIDWDSNGSKKRYTEKNREKTRLLYPNIYKIIQDKNISIKYTDDSKYENNIKFSDLKKI